jgi:hypothetical protein
MVAKSIPSKAAKIIQFAAFIVRPSVGLRAEFANRWLVPGPRRAPASPARCDPASPMIVMWILRGAFRRQQSSRSTELRTEKVIGSQAPTQLSHSMRATRSASNETLPPEWISSCSFVRTCQSVSLFRIGVPLKVEFDGRERVSPFRRLIGRVAFSLPTIDRWPFFLGPATLRHLDVGQFSLPLLGSHQ